MWSKLKNKLIRTLAPGIEDSGKEEIKFIVSSNNSFKIDLDSLIISDVMKSQIDSIQNEEKRAG